MKTKNLAAKVALVVALAAPGVMTPALAGIPVIDGANLTQTVMSAVENVAQRVMEGSGLVRGSGHRAGQVANQAVTVLDEHRLLAACGVA